MPRLFGASYGINTPWRLLIYSLFNAEASMERPKTLTILAEKKNLMSRLLKHPDALSPSPPVLLGAL